MAEPMHLGTEIGAALVKRHSGGVAEIPVGVLDGPAVLVDSVADRVDKDGWSICPCGEEHGQGEVDLGTVAVMRRHAALARGSARAGRRMISKKATVGPEQGDVEQVCQCGREPSADSRFCRFCGGALREKSLCRTLSLCSEYTFGRLSHGHRKG